MSNRSTITIDTKTAEKIFAEIALIEKRLSALRKKVMQFIPASYGSDAWWEKEIKEAESEFKKGKGIRFESANDAIKWLNS